MFHWLVLGSKMVTKDGEAHRREERNPFKRDIQGVVNSLDKLVSWRKGNSLPNILLKIMRVPWARSTGNMRGKVTLSMGELGMVFTSASERESF